MIVVRNSIIPIGEKFGAINIFGILFVKKEMLVTQTVLNHERIHTAQMRELLFLPFYLIYVVEWIWRMIECNGKAYAAYRMLTFEKEAYENQYNLQYLKNRHAYAQWKKRH